MGCCVVLVATHIRPGPYRCLCWGSCVQCSSIMQGQVVIWVNIFVHSWISTLSRWNSTNSCWCFAILRSKALLFEQILERFVERRHTILRRTRDQCGWWKLIIHWWYFSYGMQSRGVQDRYYVQNCQPFCQKTNLSPAWVLRLHCGGAWVRFGRSLYVLGEILRRSHYCPNIPELIAILL